ncbi:hypothetical protein D3C78_1135910 [compost metagenome]
MIGIFGGVDRGKAHAQRGEERRIGVVQGEAHGQRVQRVDFLDQRRQLHRLGVGEAALGDGVPWVGRIQHALKTELHVSRRQVAARAEVVGAVEFHLWVQFEDVGQAVGRYFPAVRQAGDHFAAGRVEVHQAIHQHIRRGVGGGQRVVLNDIEPLRAGLRADAQGGSLGQRAQQEWGEQQR